MAQHLEDSPLLPLPGQPFGQLDGVGAVPSDAAAEPGAGAAVEPHLGADIPGHGDLHRPGLGDGPGQQGVYVLLGHGLTPHSLTGTGPVMVRESGAAAHSTASTRTPARAASRRAEPNWGWVRSLGEKAVMPAIWTTTHTAAS